jgi:hypothetical protein
VIGPQHPVALLRGALADALRATFEGGGLGDAFDCELAADVNRTAPGKTDVGHTRS